MRIVLMMIVFAMSAATACASDPNAAASPPNLSSTAAAPTQAARPMGKIAPEMVGKVSPVPAFKGAGKGWSIDIQSSGESNGEMQHHVAFAWNGSSQSADGMLVYRNVPGSALGERIVLDGSIAMSAGRKAMEVEITTTPCTDAAGQHYPQRVRVSVTGMATMTGCGELAVY